MCLWRHSKALEAQKWILITRRMRSSGNCMRVLFFFFTFADVSFPGLSWQISTLNALYHRIMKTRCTNVKPNRLISSGIILHTTKRFGYSRKRTCSVDGARNWCTPRMETEYLARPLLPSRIPFSSCFYSWQLSVGSLWNLSRHRFLGESFTTIVERLLGRGSILQSPRWRSCSYSSFLSRSSQMEWRSRLILTFGVSGMSLTLSFWSGFVSMCRLPWLLLVCSYSLY